ncbi:MAG: M48 family metalloprotease, partial [Methyloversatilis sp.]|nr:M48 family metalloprotease [Methyloversatilis sp.]
MDVSRFEQLIHRLEAVAARNPSGYRARVAAVALLGFVILAVVLGMALLMVGALAGVVLMLFKGGGAVALIALKLGKALILLALPLWLLLKTSFRMLLARFPAPEGLEIKREDAPRLFERLDDMQRRMDGPAFHHVLLVDQLNAAVVQHPRLGLFGWNRHYLILGLPLLQTLDEDEALAVVAHEYGHLAGDHGRFGAFIYRLRGAWGQMQSMAQSWDDWGSRLVARLFDWYAPWFNAYSFVMARANEYQADRSSAELVGAPAAARALQRVGIAARFEAQDFWPGIDRLARLQAEPPSALSGEWRRALSSLDEARACSYRDEVLQESTGYGDTHPSLNDRLRALGEAPSPVLPAIGTTAAERWLGDALPRLAGVLDARWRDDVRTRWQERNSYLAERLQQLQALRENGERSVEDEWTLLQLTAELEPDVDRRPAIEA